MESSESLSADEKAYFESRGETEVKPVETPTEQAAEAAPPEVVDPETTDIDAIEEVKEPEGEDKPKVHKVVPLPALTKERQKTKDLAKQLEEANRTRAILEDRWNQILQQQPQQEAPAKAERPQGDPVALLDYLADKVDGQERAAELYQQNVVAEQQRLARVNHLAQVEAAFRQTTPDYDAALQFVAESRNRELEALYPLSTQEQRTQTILAEWDQVVGASQQTRHNPAELVYNMAKARGYVKAEPEKKPDPAADLEKLEKAVDGSTSLSEASGGAATTMSAQAIADMSPEAFGEWYAKAGNVAKFRQLAGGR